MTTSMFQSVQNQLCFNAIPFSLENGYPFKWLLGRITEIYPAKYGLCFCFPVHYLELIYILAIGKTNIGNIMADRIEDLSSYEYSKDVI